ncbi:hypothetical protein [Kribbella sp. NBC_00359]|uniref:hypothetical protein n=1 Tax=Kribbella sp. NBC_00359 TaxID=2975966 RepID=UPI002E1BD05D
MSKAHSRHRYVDIVSDNDLPPAISGLGSAGVRRQRTTLDAVSAGNRNLSQSGKGLMRGAGRDHSKRSTDSLADVPHGRDTMPLHRTC